MRTKTQSRQRKMSWAGMSITLAVIILCSGGQKAAAQQWNTNGNDISNANTGNVGIGTTTPSTLLEVKKSQNAGITIIVDNPFTTAGNSAYSGLFFKQAGVNRLLVSSVNDNHGTITPGTAQFWNFANAPTVFATNNTEQMRITATGNVGIATTSPDAKLHVFHSSTNTNLANIQLADLVLAFRNTNSTNGNMSLISFQDSAGYGNAQVGAIQKDQTNHAADLVFFTRNGAAFGERMRIRSDGNVGIGTLSPAYKLDVSGTVNSTGGLCINGDCKTSWALVGGQWANGSGGAINYSGGNVGIGTTTPTQALEVNGSALINTLYGSSAASGMLSLQSTSNTTKGTIQIGFDQTTTTSIGQSGTAGNKLLVATDRLIVNNAGVRVNGASDYGDLSVTKINIANADALQFRSSTPNIQSNGSLLFTAKNLGGDNVKFNVQNNSVSNAFVIDTNGATPAKLLDIRNLGTSKFTVSGNGDVTVAGNITAKYQDVAEWVESSQELSAGTLVVLDHTRSNQVIASSQAYDTRVAGVISERPGIALGERGDNKVLVATTGRVRLKVDASKGPIQIGDLLVTSDIPGVAMKSEAINVGGVQIHRPGTLVGKALEPLTKGQIEILVLLSLQ